MKISRLLMFTVVSVFALSTYASAEQNPRFASFGEFRQGLDQATLAEYAASRVESPAAFEEMRAHLHDLYDGVHVSHSYEVDGQVFDCIPIMEQPSVRLNGITTIATPPPPSTMDAGDPSEAAQQAVFFDPSQDKDAYGNQRSCEEGSIPMRRITLEEMTRFRTLRGFFNKIPEGLETAPSETAPSFEPPSTVLHKYSHANQQVNNWGGNGYLNLWQPAINTSKGEGFSLTQHWYVGGSGTSLPGLQTVEIGWQVYPSLYGDTKPHFFIYHTADGYNHTGCYNLTCSDFVQTSSSIHIGSSIGPVSVSGGSQYEIQIQVQFYQGNWWLRYGGTAFGYYPKALFHGGQLTKNATVVDYGTETTGTNDWPPAGSGAFSSKGWQKAAYIRDLFYLNSGLTGYWETLTRQQPSTNCFTITGPSYSSSSGWGAYFYDGGPGGTTCQ